MDVMRVPLHHQSDLVSSPIVVGVRSSLPVNGASLILGNDLAESKVQANLKIVNSMWQALSPSPIVDGPSDIFFRLVR